MQFCYITDVEPTLVIMLLISTEVLEIEISVPSSMVIVFESRPITQSDFIEQQKKKRRKKKKKKEATLQV